MECFYREQRGSGTIIEYTIVLPIVMVVIIVLMLTGYIIHDRVTMEASAERIALYVAKNIADPNYDGFVDNADYSANEINSITVNPDMIENDPYRHLFGAFTGVDTNQYENVAKQMVHANQFIRNNTVNAKVSVKGVVFRKVIVTITEQYEMPTFIASLKLPVANIRVNAVAYVNEPAEFVRNADITFELARNVSNKLGIKEKLNDLKSKINLFFNSGKKEK